MVRRKKKKGGGTSEEDWTQSLPKGLPIHDRPSATANQPSAESSNSAPLLINLEGQAVREVRVQLHIVPVDPRVQVFIILAGEVEEEGRERGGGEGGGGVEYQR